MKVKCSLRIVLYNRKQQICSYVIYHTLVSYCACKSDTMKFSMSLRSGFVIGSSKPPALNERCSLPDLSESNQIFGVKFSGSLSPPPRRQNL